MGVPIKQALKVGMYIFKQKLKKRKKYPLVLMLEPLFRCNLACVGCGKIQKTNEILKKFLTPQQCFDAANECDAPIVSIAGGEPLIYPHIVEVVEGLIAQGRYVYLCTNAIQPSGKSTRNTIFGTTLGWEPTATLLMLMRALLIY